VVAEFIFARIRGFRKHKAPIRPVAAIYFVFEVIVDRRHAGNRAGGIVEKSLNNVWCQSLLICA
jgi:hypothetical protein